MKKRRLLALLCAVLILIGTCASAASQISDALISAAKNALVALSEGNFDRVVTLLPFSDYSPGPGEWQDFAGGAFTTLYGSTPQTEYAVAYWQGSRWKIAIPLHEPNNAGVEVFVLTSEDGSRVSGYGSTSLGSVLNELSSAEYVVWRNAYNGASSAFFETDQYLF